MFVWFKSAGNKLKPSKCVLFQIEERHILSECGTETDPTKIERARDWLAPENATAVKGFLGPLSTLYS